MSGNGKVQVWIRVSTFLLSYMNDEVIRWVKGDTLCSQVLVTVPINGGLNYLDGCKFS
jgi:hypothetical protein